MTSRILPDVLKPNGQWAKTVTIDGVQCFTRAYKLWCNMKQRCKTGGAIQKNRPTYVGTSIGPSFLDFQFFAAWCQTQVGYNSGWELEKDVLVKGNKVYDEHHCLFLPQRINKLILKSDRSRGDCPLGVHFDKLTGKYFVAANDGSGPTKQYLGRYDTPEIAFGVYKSFKEKLIESVANEYRDKIDPRAYNALLAYKYDIND